MATPYSDLSTDDFEGLTTVEAEALLDLAKAAFEEDVVIELEESEE